MTRVQRTFVWCALALVVLAATAAAQTATPRQVEVFGQKIHYLEAGSGPPVILLHGLGGDAGNWALTVPALAARFRVLVPDQIGFGQSDKPQINYRVATLVDFLDGFYQQVGITKATLVGNSLGGWTALAFALAHPEKVDRLVLVASAGYSPARTGGTQLTRELLLQLNPATLAGLKQSLSLIFYNKQLITDQFVERAFVDKLRRNDGYTINQFIESVLRGEDYLDGRLGAIKAPTLIIWGREDLLTPLAMGQAFAKDIAGAETVIIDRCGHVPQLECAAPFNAALLKFLAAAAAHSSTK
jgi:2-hydroxy-6-oxonona-2,4-dienedioate hydrolase